MIKYSHINQLVYKDPLAFSQVEPGVFCRKAIVKKCRQCNRKLPTDRFYKNNNTPDGRTYKCDDCLRQYQYQKNFGGNREKAIQRDDEKCVRCGMTRDEHNKKYGEDITVDHIDGTGTNTPAELKNNKLSNLQTLCLKCHLRKDRKKYFRRVRRIDENGNETIYETIKSAAKAVGGSHANIIACCRGRLNHTAGYSWEYANQALNDIKKELQK